MEIKNIMLVKILLIFLISSNVIQTNAQKLDRMGSGLPYAEDDRNANKGFHTEINPYNNKIYYPVFWKTADSNTYKLFLDIWDGSKWSFSDTFIVTDSIHTHQINYNQFNHYQFGFNKDTVIFSYISYTVDAFNKITSSIANVKKYDGTSWTQLGNSFMLNINHSNTLDASIGRIVVWKDTLRIIGAIPISSSGKVLKWMTKFVNGNWVDDHALDMANNQGFRGELSNVKINNDLLWITLKYRDSVWCFTGEKCIGYNIKLFGGFYNEYKLAIKNNDVYLLGYMSNTYDYKLFKLIKGTFQLVNTGVSIPGYGWDFGINVVNDLLVISPLNGYGYYYVENAGKYSVFSSNLKTSIYSRIWAYSDNKRLYFSGDVSNMSPQNIVCTSLKKGTIMGKTYNDINKNSILDSGENIIPNAIVYDPDTLYKNIATISDKNGNYSLFVDFNMPISLRAKKGKYTTETTTQYDTVDVKGTKYHNIPMVTPLTNDLEVKIVSQNLGFARKADTIQYFVMVRNNGINAYNILASFSFDTLMDTVSLGKCFYNNGIATFTIDSIKTDEIKEYTFSLCTSTKYQLGDYNYITTSIQQSKYDSDSSDNFDTLRQAIIMAYDPNEKQCYPTGKTDKPVKEIVYQINFQNEGTDYARNVVISDTLSSDLPAYEITLNHASHPYKLSIDGNILYFTFENINLLPVKQDQVGSKGYINFSAKLKRDMNTGETIINKAHIYFDYEKPILTNTASVKRVDKIDTTTTTNGIAKPAMSNNFSVYPNPANGNIIVNNTSQQTQIIYIYTMDNKLIYSSIINGFASKYIDLDNYAVGIYILKNNLGEHIKLFNNR